MCNDFVCFGTKLVSSLLGYFLFGPQAFTGGLPPFEKCNKLKFVHKMIDFKSLKKHRFLEKWIDTELALVKNFSHCKDRCRNGTIVEELF
jgi:hypothetical protein